MPNSMYQHNGKRNALSDVNLLQHHVRRKATTMSWLILRSNLLFLHRRQTVQLNTIDQSLAHTPLHIDQAEYFLRHP